MSRTTSRSRKSNSPPRSHFTSKYDPQSTRRSSRLLNGANPPSEESQKIARHSLAFKQRNVFDWYEEYQYRDSGSRSPDAGDIFSSEWRTRLAEWKEQFGQGKALYDQVDSHQKAPEKLELGLFFLAHPISAFSLWHVLQACYQLDKLICGTSAQKDNKIMAWRTWRPYQYLGSLEIVSAWKHNLGSLSSAAERSTNKFEKEAVAYRLHAILDDVQFLQRTLSTLVVAFKGQQQGGISCPDWMLDLVQEGVEARCLAIEENIMYPAS